MTTYLTIVLRDVMPVAALTAADADHKRVATLTAGGSGVLCESGESCESSWPGGLLHNFGSRAYAWNPSAARFRAMLLRAAQVRGNLGHSRDDLRVSEELPPSAPLINEANEANEVEARALRGAPFGSVRYAASNHNPLTGAARPVVGRKL
jgi:hypothetical protein